MLCGPCWRAFRGTVSAAEAGRPPRWTRGSREPLTQAEWFQLIRAYPPYQAFSPAVRNRLGWLVRELMLHVVWKTNETWPGWDELMRVTGWGRSSVADYLRQLQIDGWLLLVEHGTTPEFQPMALRAANRGNRRAVYALRVPAERGQVRRQAAAARRQALLDAASVVAEAEAVLAAASARIVSEGTAADVAGDASAAPSAAAQTLIEDLLRPTAPSQVSSGEGKNWTPACVLEIYSLSELVVLSRARRMIHNCQRMISFGRGREATSSSETRLNSALTEATDTDEALRARFDEERGWTSVVESPTSGFGMLVAAAELIAAVPVLAKTGRKRLRSLLEPHWASGGVTSDVLAALKIDWAERTPASQAERIVAALQLQAAHPTLGRIAVKQLISLAAPYWRARWTGGDLVHALRWYPATWSHRPGMSDADVRFPARWAAARLTAWHDPSGRILPGHSTTSAAGWERQERLRERYGQAGASCAVLDAEMVTVADVQRRAAHVVTEARQRIHEVLHVRKVNEDAVQRRAEAVRKPLGAMASWAMEQARKWRAEKTAAAAESAARPVDQPLRRRQKPEMPAGPLTPDQRLKHLRELAAYERGTRGY